MTNDTEIQETPAEVVSQEIISETEVVEQPVEQAPVVAPVKKRAPLDKPHLTMCIFSTIMLVMYLIAGFIPSVMQITLSDFNNTTINGSVYYENNSLFLGLFAEMGNLSLSLGKLVYFAKFNFYPVIIALSFILLIVTTILTFVTKGKATKFFFYLSCILAFVPFFTYISFLNNGYVYIDLYCVLALIALVSALVIIWQKGGVGVLSSIISALILFAMVIVTVFTQKLSIVHFIQFVGETIGGHGEVAPPVEISIINYVIVAILYINLIITLMQLFFVQKPTTATFVRYAILTVATIVGVFSTLLANIETKIGTYAYVIFLILAILLILVNIRLLIVVIKKAKEKREAARQEVVVLPESEEEIDEEVVEEVSAPVVAKKETVTTNKQTVVKQSSAKQVVVNNVQPVAPEYVEIFTTEGVKRVKANNNAVYTLPNYPMGGVNAPVYVMPVPVYMMPNYSEPAQAQAPKINININSNNKTYTSGSKKDDVNDNDIKMVVIER